LIYFTTIAHKDVILGLLVNLGEPSDVLARRVPREQEL
jgi:hypothetical protein